MSNSIKAVDNNYQIYLGKEFAARKAQIHEIGPGYWIIKLGKSISDNELWFHTPENL